MSKKPEPGAHPQSFANDKSTALPLELSNHPQPPSAPRKGNKNETEG